jgi:hypothetical protein
MTMPTPYYHDEKNGITPVKKIAVWNGCYDDSWKGLISDESFAHPAKFSRGLIRRIYEYLRDEIGLPRWSVVVDPFGGVANGAVDAMDMGYVWAGCELEEKFWRLGEANIERWKRCHPEGQATIVCGDSRRLCELLGPVLRERASCVISSPPFEQGIPHQDANFTTRLDGSRIAGAGLTYGRTPGQLGSLPPGDLAAALVSSPPFQGSLQNSVEASGLTFGNARYGHADKRTAEIERTYGQTKGQLGALPSGDVAAVISSPPFLDARQGTTDR